MSLGVAIKGTEGIVLAADSRVTVQAIPPGGQPIVVTFDNATKLLTFSGDIHNHVGAVTYGAALIGSRTAHSYLPEFEPGLGTERLTIEEYSRRLSTFFGDRWKEQVPHGFVGPGMTFIVGGYNADEPYGRVYLFSVPDKPDPVEQNAGDSNFGMAWGGQLEVATRLIHGFDPALPGLLEEATGWERPRLEEFLAGMRPKIEWRVPYQILPLQDCVDLALFLIRTTITAQALSIGIRGVGGFIDVATITRMGALQPVQRKKVHGEDL